LSSLFGEHTAQVLSEAGLSAAEIGQLVSARVSQVDARPSTEGKIMPDDDRAVVARCFSAQGLNPSEAELARLVALYPRIQVIRDMLYAMDAVRYAEPVTSFDARMVP
jgi:hypothetical protein